jgi:hypothetical protein
MIRVFGIEEIYEAKTEVERRLQNVGDVLVGLRRRIRKWKLVRDVEAEWTLEEDGDEDLSKEMIGSKPPQWMIAEKEEELGRPNIESDCSDE